jgi:hypothetical protein
VGKKFGKSCSEEGEWNDRLQYNNPSSPKIVALYIYPKEDHNNAFGFCEEGRFGLGFCHWIYSQSQHYSVVYRRVGSVEDRAACSGASPDAAELPTSALRTTLRKSSSTLFTHFC